MDKRGIGSGERPLLAITMGDAAGIGPEIIVKALARPEVLEMCRPLVIGDVAIMENHLRFWPGNGASGNDAVASVRPTVRRVASPELVSDVALGDIPVFQPGEALAGVEPGKLSAEGGRGAVEFVKAATALARDGRIAGIVAAPLAASTNSSWPCTTTKATPCSNACSSMKAST